MLLIDPRDLTAVAWAAEAGRQLAGYGPPIPKLLDEKDWRHWAQQIVLLPGIAAATPPWPGSFATWRDWALRFNLSVQNLPDLPI